VKDIRKDHQEGDLTGMESESGGMTDEKFMIEGIDARA
jgi:hypothetical protein